MNLFSFLKSRIGAISLSAGKTAGLALTVGALGLHAYNYMTDRPAAQEARVRAFSEILASGGTLPNDNTISISSGETLFATPEEIAAREGQMFDGGESAIAAFSGATDGMSVKGSSLGVGEDGLGMGSNAAVLMGPDGKPLVGNVAGADGAAVGAAVASANQAKSGQQDGAQGPTLQRASIARASGGNSSSSSGGFGGTASRGASSTSVAARTEASARINPYDLTGSMPKGSTLIASNDSIRSSSRGSSQMMGGGRFSRAASGTNSKEGKSLRDIALASSKVAANANRSANEGTSPFLARERLSGGITVAGETANEFAGSSSSDFVNDMDRRERGFAQAANNVDNTEQERKEHRSRLIRNMLTLILSTVGACWSIHTLMELGRKGGPYAWVAYAGAALIGAAMLVAIASYIVDCGRYISKYKEQRGWAIAGIVLGVLMLAAVAISYFNFSKGEEKTLEQGVTENTAQGSGEAGGQAAGEAGGQAAGEAGGQAAGEAGGQAAGQAGGQAAGQAGGQAAGEAAGQAAGEAAGQAAGEAAGQAAGEAAGQAAEEVAKQAAEEAAKQAAEEAAKKAAEEAAKQAAKEQLTNIAQAGLGGVESASSGIGTMGTGK